MDHHFSCNAHRNKAGSNNRCHNGTGQGCALRLLTHDLACYQITRYYDMIP